MISFVCSRLKSIFLSIIGLFRRALCCSRNRTHCSDDEILTGINVHDNNYSPKKTNHVERDWSSWDDSPRTVEEHIERYRETLAQKVAPAAAVSSQIEKEPDYFGDMEPTTIKQAKYLIASGSSNQQSENFTRLKATVQADIPISNELEDWDEDNKAAGWDEITNENTKQLIRDKRKELRSQKQQSSREKSTPSSFLQAERLSSNR